MATKIERRGIYLFIEGKQIKNDLKSIRTEFYKANASLAKMEVGSKQYNEQMQKVGQLKGMLDKHNSSVRETSKQWNNAGQAVEKKQSKLSKLLGSAKGLLPAFGFAAIIGGAVQAARALFNMYTETAKARREAEQLTGLSGKPLADLTAGIQATAQTFAQDFSEVLTGVNSISKTMGITAEEALAKINDGFISGADSSGDFMDIISEYGVQFKAAGLSADESIALISQQVKSGIWSSSGIDSIKEATLSLREMTPATAAALDNIGISSDEIQNKLRNGTISIFDAIQMVSNRMAELPPQSSEVGTALADIWKGAGEDAGLEYITMLGTAELSLEKVKKGAGENAIVQERLLEANTQLKLAWSELLGTGTGTFTAIKATATELLANGIAGLATGLKDVRDWFIELYNGSLPVRAGFQYMLASWVTGFNLAKTAIQGLWEQLKLGGKLIKAVLTFDLSGIKEAFQDASNNTKQAVITNAQTIANTWKSAYENTLKGKIKVGGELTPDEPNGNSSPFTPDPNQGEPGGADGDLGRDPGSMEGMESIDPRISSEESLTETILEQSKLRESILDNEQQAARDRARSEEQIQQQRRDSYLSTLDTIINVFGQESAIGKAALMAKQAYAIAETIINIAKGTGETAASAPFPANIPLIIGFVGQVAALVGTIKGASKKTEAYAAGGYTQGESMYIAGEAGTEWIAPNWMMRNPAIAQVIGSLENLRSNRTNINPAVASSSSNNSGKSQSLNLESVNTNSSILELSNTITKLSKNIKYQAENPPSVSVEMIEKARKQWVDINLNSGL